MNSKLSCLLISCLPLLASVSGRASTNESFPLGKNAAIAVWIVAGPLPSDSNQSGMGRDFLQSRGGEEQAAPSEQDLIELSAEKTVYWSTTIGENSGELNFFDVFPNTKGTHAVAYAFCQLESDSSQEVILKIRHAAGFRAWLNQKVICNGSGAGATDVREERIRVALKQGSNSLLCKSAQQEENWAFTISVLGLDGKPAKDVASSVATTRQVKNKIHSAQFSAAPVVLKTSSGERGILMADISSGGIKGVSLKVSSPGWPDQQAKSVGDLPFGKNRVEVEIPAISEGIAIDVRVESTTDTNTFEKITLSPPKKWTIYLTQHTHTDIGYTRPQTEILPEHLRYIDYALDYCDLTDGYPDDARFRWTCETSWAVREYVKRRPPEQIQRLKKRLQEGRIEVAGMLLNMSEIATETSMAASLQPIRMLKDDFGVSVQTAMQNDVNGAAWCLVEYFNDIGIKYLTMGINKTRSILPFDKPTAFWWESPSGKRVLAYRSDHYMTGNFWSINKGELNSFKPGVLDYIQSLEKRGYPFDRIGVQFSGYYTDNSPPSTIGSDVVKKWNETYAWPHLRISTAHEFLEYVEKEHGKDLSVHRQAWPDWWTDGFGSAARETAASRATHSSIQISQNLFSMAALLGSSIKPDVLRRVAAIQDDLLFYDEHTYGAAESINEPLAENSQVQWGEKSSYVWDAVKNSSLLREEALGLLQDYLPRAEVPTLAIFNTLNWERSGLAQIFIDHQILPSDKDFRIVDAKTGEVIPAQAMNSRAEGTYWALWIKDVPPGGYKTVRIEAGKNPRVPPAKPSGAAGSLENGFYSITFDPEKGAIKSLIDKENGREWVDQNSPWGMGQCIYETLPANRTMKREAFTRMAWRNVKVKKGADGPVWKSLLLSADLDGCSTNNGVHAEFRLYELEKRIEFHFVIKKLPISSPEAVYVSFPFQCPEANIRYEAQGGLVTPGKDQIPGSASDWQTVQSFISVRNDDGQIVLGSEEAPLVQLGDFNLGKWQPITQIEKPRVYSWVMNNYWFTNFRAYQEGEFKWFYYLTSAKDVSATLATRFGWSSRIPLVCRVLPARNAEKSELPAFLSTWDSKASNIVLVSAKPAASGHGIILHLREIEGKAVSMDATMVSAKTQIQGTEEVNVLEETLKTAVKSVSFKPYEAKFIKLIF